jgi:hypothetical protein
MAIDINSLFADIIDTPEQRQQKLLQQGMVQGQLLSSGLRGRAAALAPLAQMAGQLGVQRQEDLRRAVQPMLGIDPRTTGERLQDQLKNIDTSTPEGKKRLIEVVQSVDPVRAAALRQQFAEEAAQKAKEQRELSLKERAMTVDESRAQTQARQIDLGEQQLDFNIDVQNDLNAWRNQQGEDADADRLLKKEELRLKEQAQNLAQQDLGSRDRAALREVEQEAETQFNLYTQAKTLADEFQSIEGTEGSSGKILAKWRSITGQQDKRDLLIADFNRIKNSAALGGLPPGAASDKDIQMVLQGFPDDTYPPEAIASYMRGMAKMSALATEKEKQRMQFMISNKGVGVGIDSTTGETVTFMDLWQRKTQEDGFADYMQEKYPINWDNSEFVSPRKLSIQNAAAKRAEAELRRQQSREAVPPTLRGGLM